MEKAELPLGFSFALAMNPEAMKCFTGLSPSQQADIVRKAHAVTSKSEMQALVNNLSAESISKQT